MFLLDLLFPKTCLSCGTWGKYVCNTCKGNIEHINKQACFYCDRITPCGFTHEGCVRPQEFDGVISYVYYNATSKKLIRNIKYSLVTSACNEFFEHIHQNIQKNLTEFKNHFPEASFQPIPLHAHRQQLRGFNQAVIFAQYLQKIMRYPIEDNLYRCKETKPQAQTNSRLERYYNMQYAFKVKSAKKVKDRNIILIDDVITTGNTTKVAAHTLKKAGAKNVFVMTIARG